MDVKAKGVCCILCGCTSVVHLAAVWLSDHLDTKLCTGIKKFYAVTAFSLFFPHGNT